jgi:hypothetical protein
VQPAIKVEDVEDILFFTLRFVRIECEYAVLDCSFDCRPDVSQVRRYAVARCFVRLGPIVGEALR